MQVCCSFAWLLLVAQPLLWLNQKSTTTTKASKYESCQDLECSMKASHFNLYSNLKRALDSEFDISGKELVPLLRSVDILSRRFNQNQAIPLNGTDIVLNLLKDERLTNAMRVFDSDQGRQLVQLYGSSVSGRRQNLACSQWRTSEISRAARLLEASSQLASVFAKIHKNFVKKSAKKCLKQACSSVDNSMSQLDDSVASRRKSVSASSASSSQAVNDQLVGGENPREFYLEELELCRFLKRNNDSNCQISGRELSEITFSGNGADGNQTTISNLQDYLNDYHSNQGGKSSQVTSSSSSNETTNLTHSNSGSSNGGVLASCRSIGPLLAYNLAGLRWYLENNIIEQHKFASRLFWCPSLAYWLELDRLCGELEAQASVFTNWQQTTAAIGKQNQQQQQQQIANRTTTDTRIYSY